MSGDTTTTTTHEVIRGTPSHCTSRPQPCPSMPPPSRDTRGPSRLPPPPPPPQPLAPSPCRPTKPLNLSCRKPACSSSPAPSGDTRVCGTTACLTKSLEQPENTRPNPQASTTLVVNTYLARTAPPRPVPPTSLWCGGVSCVREGVRAAKPRRTVTRACLGDAGVHDILPAGS
ncbi:hypothetical protein E2C01_097181 [Portunus trituberculatus]|uniref:Uncharacterized protein n=1 Tax=Portunus trituberculatus TaxID=210409 RepID=A0A5B7KAJ7_PORTR|nr:hypothetical protein [Portunus trituberculatus]